jgi:2-(1,2-epoxy-1,2-dihydrophenyl)acetyl-CoA isomerase
MAGDPGSLMQEHQGSVAILTLNRPSRRNALSADLIDRLREAFVRLDTDPETRVVVLAGSGGVFSAGADLRAESLGAERILREHYEPLVKTMLGLDLPIIAAIDGFAVGAGASIAMACDFRVMASDAYFYLPFAGLGLSPDAGMTWLLPRIVGTTRAVEMSMLGSRISAASAHSWGMANAVADESSCLELALDLANRLAAQSSSLGAIKAAILHGWASDFEEQLQYERELQPRLQALPDYAEAIDAFRERRPASFGPRPIATPVAQEGTA